MSDGFLLQIVGITDVLRSRFEDSGERDADDREGNQHFDQSKTGALVRVESGHW